MGGTVARNLQGAGIVHDDPHWFWSDQFDERIEMSGFATSWDQTVIRGSITPPVRCVPAQRRWLPTFSMN
jgi:hypothetical protein